MKYGLIGCGRIAPSHIGAACLNGLDIVAICDIVPEKMDDLLENMLKYGDMMDFTKEKADKIKKYTDYKQMIEENDLEMVAIATVSGPHHDIAKFCIEHGLHTLIEKPMSMSMADADEIVALQKQYGVTVGTNHEFRFFLAVQELKKAIDAGRFGRISHIVFNARANKQKSYYDQAAWRGTWADDGGTLMNQCTHVADKMRWLMGDDVESITAHTRQVFHNYIQGEDLGLALIKFGNGVIGTFEGTSNVFPGTEENKICVFGEKGTVRLSHGHVETWKFSEELPGDEEVRKMRDLPAQPWDNYGNGHPRLYADFIDAVKTGRDPLVSAQGGRNSMEFVLAMYKSQKEGVTVKLPLTDFASIDMMGYFDAPASADLGADATN